MLVPERLHEFLNAIFEFGGQDSITAIAPLPRTSHPGDASPRRRDVLPSTSQYLICSLLPRTVSIGPVKGSKQ